MNDQNEESFEMEKNEMLKWQIIGPLSLLCAFVLAAKHPLPYDLYAASLLGLFFSARWHFRGCFYALVLLISVGIVKHWMGNLHHFWHLGLEGAVACSFFITALAFENSSLKLESLYAQLAAKAAALANSEADLEKTVEDATKRQMIAAEKIDVLQKDLEETQQEKGSFEVLNDVLRKVTSHHQEEKNQLKETSTENQRRLAQAYAQMEDLKKEVSNFKNTDHELEKEQLLGELNSARVEKEQSHLINEKLVRLHAKESMRAQGAMDQLQNVLEEKRNLQQQLRQAIQETATSMLAFKQAEEDQEKNQKDVDSLGRLQQEKLFLQDRLRSYEVELSLLKKTPEELNALRKERDLLASQFARAQEKIQFLSKLEPLYKQLKAQFDEKNQILHETRASLFYVDTELQTLKMEREQMNLQHNPASAPLYKEFIQLDEELASLQKENEELQSLVTHLVGQMPQGSGKDSMEKTLSEALSSIKRKKKIKSKGQDVLL